MIPPHVWFTPVPTLFWSEYSGKPFLKCISCQVPLMESDLYVVQKRIVRDEAVLEMAMCNRCREQQSAEMSEETRRNTTEDMARYFQKQAEDQIPDSDGPQIIEVAQIEDPEQGEAMMKHCTDHCLICRTARSECYRYSLIGVCRDENLVVQVTPISQAPFMVCEKCELGMADLVSQETRDSWDRFIEDHFDGPPGVEVDSPSSYPLAF